MTLTFAGIPSYVVYGPHGGLSMKIALPVAFEREQSKCPLVIMMHGFMSNKDQYPFPGLADTLAELGIASIRFDFDAHGDSEGDFVEMSLSSEIADAKAILEYAHRQPYVTDIALLGHSQGAVIAGMLAGEMEGHSEKPKCVVQLAPAAVLKDDAIAGRCMNAKYDPSNIPEYVNVFTQRVGRNYFLESQNMPIFETSARYSGAVCIIQGDKDTIVPVSHSEMYHQLYKNSELHILKGEGHILNGNKAELVKRIVTFLQNNLQ